MTMGRAERSAAASMSWRKLALPAEHGSWGLVLEPIGLGLLVAPSGPGALLGVAAFAAFLTRWPLKMALRWRGAPTPRAAWAWRFALAYAGAALLALAGVLAAAGAAPLAPLLAASPLAAVFLVYDVRNESRGWQAELAGAVAFATVTAAIARAGGWALAPACALSAALAARAITTVLYVRARIRLDRDRPAGRIIVLAAHGAALAAVGALTTARLVPALALAPSVVLAARAALGLAPNRRRVSIKTIGFLEVGFGVFTVLALAAGYW
jgi:hypothetical protein